MTQKLTTKEVKQLIQQDKELFNFTQQLFQQISVANPQRISQNKLKEKSILDTFSRLLVGDEICAALAISKNELLLATNQDTHLADHISVKTTWTIREIIKPQKKGMNTYLIRLEFLSYLYYNEKFIAKTSSGLLEYPCYRYLDRYHLLNKGDSRVSLRFTPAQHQIPDNSADVVFNMEIEQEFISSNLPINNEYPIANTGEIELNPLRRRLSYFLQHLSFIARITLDQDPIIKMQALTSFEDNKARFLRSSIPYEIAAFYPNHLKPYENTNNGMDTVGDFIEWLVKDYENYQYLNIRDDKASRIACVKTWVKQVPETIKQSDVPVPAFIRSEPDKFIERGLKYFIDLVKAEEFIKQDAKQGGRLSQIISVETIYQRTLTVKIIDNTQGGIPKDNMHAEMRILEHLLKDKANPADYVGISKLCCAFCTYTMKQFKLDYRGSHGTLFAKWVLGNVLKQPAFLREWLGEELYRSYEDLHSKNIRLPKQKKHERTDKQAVALMIIEALPGLNDRDYLRTSGIGEAYFIPGVQTGSAMYPADSDDEEDNNVKAVEEGTYKPVTLLNKLGVLLSDSARKHPSSQENAVKTDKDLKLSALDFSRR